MGNKELEIFYTSLCNILKKYLFAKYFFNATKMTTDEILNYLISNDIDSAELKSLFEEADLCRFAQKQYGATNLLEAKNSAKSIIANLEGLTI